MIRPTSALVSRYVRVAPATWVQPVFAALQRSQMLS